MIQILKRSTVICCFSAIIVVTMSVRGALSQSDDKEVLLKFDQVSAEEVLDRLSIALDRPVVFDGTLPKSKYSATMSLSKPNLVKAIGSMLDADGSVTKRGSVTFVKRFKNEPDLPQAYAEQINVFAIGALKIIPRATPSFGQEGWPDEARALGRLLSPEMISAMQAGRVISWQELNSAQQAQMSAAVYSRAFGAARFGFTLLELISREPEKTQLVKETGVGYPALNLPPNKYMPLFRFGF